MGQNTEVKKDSGINRKDLFRPREIQPATPQIIKELIDKEHNTAVHSREHAYGRRRGADRILDRGMDYAELPGYKGRLPREIIQKLPSGSSVLDVGCGYGQLGAQILGIDSANTNVPPINENVKVYGFDVRTQNGQERLTKVVIGSIDDLSPQTFSDNPEGFDLVISSSTLYHLPDYWGAILRMARVLKPEGILLTSTLPRAICNMGGRPISVENEKGFLVYPDSGFISYYRNGNILDINGRLIPPGELVDILNKFNKYFNLEYGVATSKQGGVDSQGGQISGQRLSISGTLDLSCMFYCLSNGNLGYIVAQSPEEKKLLTEQGYVNLHER